MKLLAICTGNVAPLLYRTAAGDVKTVASGINKKAVSTLHEPNLVELKKLGLQGDEQCNLSVHGGLDKAVYMMPAEHYSFWQLRRQTHNLDSNLPWGMLGENLVVEGLLENEVRMGDELEISGVRLRVTDPREPCFKFAIRMGYSNAPKDMVQQGNCGWYLRVVQTGTLKAGDSMIHHANPRGKTILEQFRFLTRKGQMDLLED
ncbi:MOSC domain-containing protein [Limnobacter humi]|uniref:MOSC domain-containing protein n=1 Tax=Limnobacter humi TaxID=1778671 RepID=A0ABT1WDQ1_9BURK|nr:MOSC domain-containing protein [Limnobacter humi]MCQ8895646.1 MOSC domain-containing protein [Limnobacter humi]